MRIVEKIVFHVWISKQIFIPVNNWKLFLKIVLKNGFLTTVFEDVAKTDPCSFMFHFPRINLAMTILSISQRWLMSFLWILLQLDLEKGMMDCLYAKCEFNEVSDFGIYLSSFLNAVSLSLRNYDVTMVVCTFTMLKLSASKHFGHKFD